MRDGERLDFPVSGGMLSMLAWPGDAGALPLIALHGFTGSAETWQGLADRLGSRRTVIAVDLPGHGRTRLGSAQSPCGMDGFASALGHATSALGYSDFHLLGYSLGGRTALCCAGSLGGSLASLTLESASPGIADATERTERAASDGELATFIETEGIEAFVNRWEDVPVLASQKNLEADERHALRNQRLACSPDGLAASLRGMGTGAQEDQRGTLASLRVPALILAGEHDEKFRGIADSMAEAAPEGRLRIVAGCGHSVHLEQRDAHAKLVAEFLEDVEAD